jgi:hypothetical protein
VLRSTFLGNDEQTRRRMPQADCRAGFIAFLPTRTAGAVRINGALRQQLRVTEVGPRLSPMNSHHEAHASHE